MFVMGGSWYCWRSQSEGVGTGLLSWVVFPSPLWYYFIIWFVLQTCSPRLQEPDGSTVRRTVNI